MVQVQRVRRPLRCYQAAIGRTQTAIYGDEANDVCSPIDIGNFLQFPQFPPFEGRHHLNE